MRSSHHFGFPLRSEADDDGRPNDRRIVCCSLTGLGIYSIFLGADLSFAPRLSASRREMISASLMAGAMAVGPLMLRRKSSELLGRMGMQREVYMLTCLWLIYRVSRM